VLVCLKGGRVVDPVQTHDAVGDVYFESGRIVDAPSDGRKPDAVYDVSGKVVMAGAIDPHSHIAGSNVTMARSLMPELPRLAAEEGVEIPASPGSWGAFATGLRYAQMGYTTVIEPAVSPTQALQSHLELSQIPIIDVGGLVILGNDDFTLGLLRDGASEREITDYVAWTLQHSKCLGLKVINAGGSAAFKFNAKSFSLDDVVPEYGVTSRAIVKALQHAVDSLGLPHPLHIHCNNLGIAGNVETAVATMHAAEGLPMHFAHIQFYGYGKEGDSGLSSAAPQLMEAVNGHPNVTVDVGQILFGQTVTISGDILRQFDGRRAAKPKKWALDLGDANGTGIVPYKYRAKSFVNAVQWSVGLEIFLLADDLWRVLFTTDHPNGALFTRYPEIIHLLMSREERARWIETLPEAARAVSHLSGISRELSLSEIAVLTRGGPARLLGLKDRGHLGPGAVADIAVYSKQDNKAVMFDRADLVFKDGEHVVEGGEVVKITKGKAFRIAPDFDRAIARRLDSFWDRYYGISPETFSVPEDLVSTDQRFATVPCRS
jgi:formylmethanofuran dehydrogenase subunit A